MDFENAYQKFLDGTATHEEIDFVREEINKSKKVVEVLDGGKPVVKEAEIATVKKATKQFNLRLTIRILLIVFASLAVSCAIVLGSVFGVATSSAKKNSVTKDEAIEIAKAYVEKEYGTVSGNIWVGDVDRDMIMSAGLTHSYYEYELEIHKGPTVKLDIEINGKNGEIIYAKLDR